MGRSPSVSSDDMYSSKRKKYRYRYRSRSSSSGNSYKSGYLAPNHKYSGKVRTRSRDKDRSVYDKRDGRRERYSRSPSRSPSRSRRYSKSPYRSNSRSRRSLRSPHRSRRSRSSSTSYRSRRRYRSRSRSRSKPRYRSRSRDVKYSAGRRSRSRSSSRYKRYKRSRSRSRVKRQSPSGLLGGCSKSSSEGPIIVSDDDDYDKAKTEKTNTKDLPGTEAKNTAVNSTPVLSMAGNLECSKNAIDDINNPGFVQRQFTSSRKEMNLPIQSADISVLNGHNIAESSCAVTRTNVQNNTVFSDNIVLIDESEKLKRWVKKLLHIRQQILQTSTNR